MVGGNSFAGLCGIEEELRVVCNEKEYATAKVEDREPEGIGFPREAVKALRGS